MRELISVAQNVHLTKTADGWEGGAEIIVITSEPQYYLDEDLDFKTRRRECEQFRFLATERQITRLIEGLEKARFELQTAEMAANLANQEKAA